MVGRYLGMVMYAGLSKDTSSRIGNPRSYTVHTNRNQLFLVYNYPNIIITFIFNAQVDAFNMSVNSRRNDTSCDKYECQKHTHFGNT